MIFAADATKRFLRSDSVPPGLKADLALSLDVIYHLVEDHVFDAYMRRLFESARRFVIIYSSNADQETPAEHVRHRQFTRWVEHNRPGWHLHSYHKNSYPFDSQNIEQTSFADFYVYSPIAERVLCVSKIESDAGCRNDTVR